MSRSEQRCLWISRVLLTLGELPGYGCCDLLSGYQHHPDLPSASRQQQMGQSVPGQGGGLLQPCRALGSHFGSFFEPLLKTGPTQNRRLCVLFRFLF